MLIGRRNPYDKDSPVNPVVSERLFKDQIAPIVMRIFFVRDFNIRSSMVA